MFVLLLSAQALANPTGDALQLVLVVTPAWDGTSGVLRRFERPAPGTGWSPAGPPMKIGVGRGGMAWGLGLHGHALDDGPLKHEGDMRSPAGVFQLTGSFGTEGKPGEARTLEGFYTQLRHDTECVEDQDSSYYNKIVRRNDVPGGPGWKTKGDIMGSGARKKLFHWGVVVGHNTGRRPLRGAGSCVFIHVWREEGQGSAGCTVGSDEDIRELVGWLRPGTSGVLVQLPQKQYDKLKDSWLLP